MTSVQSPQKLIKSGSKAGPPPPPTTIIAMEYLPQCHEAEKEPDSRWRFEVGRGETARMTHKDRGVTLVGGRVNNKNGKVWLKRQDGDKEPEWCVDEKIKMDCQGQKDMVR